MEYYINKPVCQETNKKLRALSTLLKEYESSIIEFSDTFTPRGLEEEIRRLAEQGEHREQLKAFGSAPRQLRRRTNLRFLHHPVQRRGSGRHAPASRAKENFSIYNDKQR